VCGLYRPAKGGTVPTAKALKTGGGPGEACCDGLLDMLGGLFGRQTGVAPPPCVPQFIQQYVAEPILPVPGGPCLPPQACPLPAPPVGAVVAGPFPPPGYPLPMPPLPAGGMMPPGCAAPPMLMAPPPPMVRMEAPVPARTGYAGEWNRTVGPCTIGLSVAANQLTAKGVIPVNGESLRVTLTADCREIREGLVAGVITSAEVEPADATDYRPETDPGRLRRLVDQPFSCRFQVRGNELIVIDVKVGGEYDVDANDLAIIGGRYARGEPKWPAAGAG